MLIFLIAAIIGIFDPTEGEYYIRDRDIPSFLYKKFNSVDEEVFPRDIVIRMSLTRVSGDLLYSIDKNMNQLILTLQESMEETLVVQFNKQEFGVSLPQLCGCERCRFETFNLRVMMEDTLNLQCNGESFRKIKYNRIKALNEDYILPYNQSHNSSTNEAHLWLVNNPQDGHIYPNSNQMSGCIFNVSYRGREVEFTEISTNVKRRCKNICTTEICNGGRCLETYNGEPYCECTTTFRNGRYCNDRVRSQNLISTSPHLSFVMFKVSWQSLVTDLFTLENEHVRLRLHRSDNILIFEYKDLIIRGSSTYGVLSDNYLPGEKYILIGTFHESSIGIDIYQNMVRSHMILFTGMDLGREMFTSMTLRSGNGTIGIAYKISSKVFLWNHVQIFTHLKLHEEKEHEYSNGKIKFGNDGSSKLHIIAAVIPVAGVIALVVVVFAWSKWIHHRRSRLVSSQISFSNVTDDQVPLSMAQDECLEVAEEDSKIDT